MDKKQVRKLKRELSELRGRTANIRSKELIRFAKKLGRKLSDRGKEPTYISEVLPNSIPISIPNHPGSLNKFTAGNILDQLEQDLLEFDNMNNNDE